LIITTTLHIVNHSSAHRKIEVAGVQISKFQSFSASMITLSPSQRPGTLKPCNLETFDLTFYTDSFPFHSFLLAPGKRARGGFMQRCGAGLLLTLSLFFVLAFTGCLGKSSSNPGSGGVTSITLSPASNLSLDVGSTQVFSASARDALGRVILGVDIQFIVVSGTPNAPAPLSIASNGNACAGTWDATVSICSPGTSGIAYVTAVTAGVSSTTATVFVHQHVDSIQIVSAETQPPQHDCFSQGQTWHFRGLAFSNNIDITNSVGPMSWSFSNSGVVTPSPVVSGTQDNPVYLELTTAKSPGITQLFASISGTTSTPYAYTTCLIQAIRLQIGGQAQSGSSITVNNGGSVPLTATAIDSLYNIVNFGPLASPPLTWSTTNPEVATFNTTTNTSGTNTATARANLGGATLTASCSPPSCNIGVLPGLPIYASDGLLPNGTTGYGAISVDVTSTSKPPTYTAWAATTGCQNAPGCSSAMFSVTPNTTGANPIGAIVGLPRTPNSMMFNHGTSPRVYLGSDQGLMFVDVTASNPSVTLVSGASIPCNASLCGKILTISNDGKFVVVADTVSTPSQIYIYNASSTTAAPVDLIIPGQTATAAAFSPDQLKLFILTNTGNMFVYSTVDALSSVAVATSVTGLAFSADGSFAYVAGTPAGSVSAFSTCSLPGIASKSIAAVAASTTPLQIFPSPNTQADLQGLTQNLYALEPPNVEVLTAQQFTQVPIPYQHPLQLTCNPPTIQSFTKGASFNLGQGNFTPLYSQLVADGNEMIVVAMNIPAVLVLNTNDGTTTSVPLVGGANPLAASASTDGSQVYVAACDQYDTQPPYACAVGSIHIINTVSQGDIQQVPYVNVNQNNNRNMCTNSGNPAPICLPDMVAIRPQ
jgi:hypothetical protein